MTFRFKPVRPLRSPVVTAVGHMDELYCVLIAAGGRKGDETPLVKPLGKCNPVLVVGCDRTLYATGLRVDGSGPVR